jgi:hypothetical protein
MAGLRKSSLTTEMQFPGKVDEFSKFFQRENLSNGM